MSVSAIDVAVHGLGAVGLPLAAALAQRIRVYGVERCATRRLQISTGEVGPEPGLHERTNEAISTGQLQIGADPVTAPIHLLCLPTPLRDHRAQLSALDEAIGALAPLLREGDLVVIESTIPPGTTDTYARKNPGIHWAHAPERILPGHALSELASVPRVVGGQTPEATERVAAFYRQALQVEVHTTDARTAECVKLAENTFRDVNIALANEVFALSRGAGADADEVLALANLHPRVAFLAPGIGVGGHCLPVDPWFLAQDADALLIPAARAVNLRATGQTIEKICVQIHQRQAKIIGVLGLSYKAGTADVRNSPALAIAQRLTELGHDVRGADPLAQVDTGLQHDLAAVLAESDLLVLLVAHPELVKAARDTQLPVLDCCGGLR